MSALITAEYFQEQMATLGLKSTFAPSSYALDTLIAEASDWVENYTDRRFEVQTVTETLRGPIRKTEILILPEYPITDIVSVTWEDENGQTGGYDVDFFRILKGGRIEWMNPYRDGFWSGRYYTVEYEFGYDPVPTNVQRATALKIADLLQPQYQGPQEREIFMVTNIQGMIVDLLEPYRRERLG